MKIPKKIKMFGYDWKVKVVDGESSEYNWDTFIITLAKKYWQEALIHEILEACLVQNHCRYYGQEGSMEKEFHFNHTGLCLVHKLLFQILKDNNLLNH